MSTLETIPTLEDLKRIVRLNGYTASGGSWEDDRMIYAFSVESSAPAYGHPLFEAQYHKESKWLHTSLNRYQKVVGHANK